MSDSFHDSLDAARERAGFAPALGDGTEEYAAKAAAVERVRERIDNLLSMADRFDHPGGSRRLAQRARDKAAGMETALRLLAGAR